MFKNKFNALWLLGLLAIPTGIYFLGSTNVASSNIGYNQVNASNTNLSNATTNRSTGLTIPGSNSSSRAVLSLSDTNNTNSFSNFNNTGLNSGLNTGLNSGLNTGLSNTLGNNLGNTLNNSFANNTRNQNTQVLNGNSNSLHNDGYPYNTQDDRRQERVSTQRMNRTTASHDNHDTDHHHAEEDYHVHDEQHEGYNDAHSHATEEMHAQHNVVEITAVGNVNSSHGSFVIQQPITTANVNGVVTPSGARAVNDLGLDPQVRAGGTGSTGNHVTTNAIYGSTQVVATGNYDAYGYDEYGYDAYGYDREGYDWDGYSYQGYDREGYDYDGYNVHGYDRNGQYGW